MNQTLARHLGFLSLALTMLLPRITSAERLFVRADGLPTHTHGIERVQQLALDTDALASLRARTQATLTEFPLGVDRTATLTVDRFEPFTDGTHAVIMEDGGPRDLALPDQLYFRGKIAGDAASIVMLVAGADTARGFVSTGDAIYRFGRDREGVHRSWGLADADPRVFRAPGAFCGNDEEAALVTGHGGRIESFTGPDALPPPVAPVSPPLLVEVAIETDQEFLKRFSSSTDALTYLADLAAAASAIFDADTNVRVRFGFLRLWSTTDPWTSTALGGMLTQVQGYWKAYEAQTPRDSVHFISGRGVIGGIAYVDVLCDPGFGFGVSTVYGSFDVLSPRDTWDVVVVTHELGHNFGSPHTHCYDPPVDHCYNQQAGCYAGPTSLPAGGGTIMSYCHTLPGGIANVSLTFGATVSAMLRAGAESSACVGPPCGDGKLDPGEDCDDGNTVDGDCCSANCTAEPDGGACDDGEACTTDHCASGACVGMPVRDGTACDDGSQCTVDACRAGACVGTPAPSVSCKRPTLPLKAELLLKSTVPDTTRTPNANNPPGKDDQLSWTWTKGQSTTLTELGGPMTSDDYELCVYGPGPSLLFSGHVPAGGTCGKVPCWKAMTGKGYSYTDKKRLPDGMEKLDLAAGAPGEAKISMKGKGVNLNMPALGDLALPIEVQLRGAGECWAATYSTAIANTPEQFKAKSD